MKNLSLCVSLLMSVLSLGVAAPLQEGASAPDFMLEATSGEVYRLSDFRGKYVVLEWTNHQCPFVKKFYREGHMQALQKELTEAGVVWLQIVSSATGKQGYVTAEEGERLREAQQVASSAMLLDTDGAVGKRYGAKTTPHMFLIHPTGKLLYQGAIDSIRSTKTTDIARADNYLKDALEASIAGEPIIPAVTKPYGCGVKY